MPVIINEIVIRTNIDKGDLPPGRNAEGSFTNERFEEIIQEAVQQVLEILEQKKHR